MLGFINLVIVFHIPNFTIIKYYRSNYCKAVLGIKKTSCNISAKSELGRLPLDSFIKTQVMLYYSRIQSDGINHSDFAEILQDVFLIPRTALQNL
jgi:hypothetical protein